ncbi:MAG: CPA2 family monovalent cation:H+ antiporter-2 [Candidatus Latescibacterota bacterium]|jgi:CPA2 family monovalent cation:H+ antiporter-2
MHDIAILTDVALIFAAALGVNLLLARLKQPAILGYILSGLLIGPHGLGWIAHNDLELLAEVGVILLMFTLGIEFSLDKIKRVKTIALGGGSLQVGLTVLIGVGAAYLLGWTWYRGVYLGCLVALSSSAIVLKLLQEGGELDTLHGRVALGILLFQDIAVVPMMIILPALASPEQGLLVPLGIAAGKAILFLACALIASRVILPRVFFWTARTGSRELFLLMVFTLCMGTAYVSYLAGLSLALGAFVAGMVVSDSEYSLQTLSDILPFKDAFLCIFFVSVGMLLDPGFVFNNPEILGLLVVLVLGVNAIICTAVVRLFKYPLRVAIFAGAALSQIGEFSFVLAQMGKSLNLIGDYLYQLTLAGTVMTMVVTPQLFKLGRALPGGLMKLGLPERWFHGQADADLENVHLNNHVIICGFGPVGEHISMVLKENDIPYVILDLNASRIKSLQDRDIPAYYGDSSSSEVLLHADIKQARAVVVTYADPYAARRTVALAKSLQPTALVLARTRLPEDIAELRRLGADRVIEEEFEVSLEMASWTMQALGASWLAVETEKAAIQRDDYQLFIDQNTHLTELNTLAHAFSTVEIVTFEVGAESAWVGQAVGDLHLRSELGLTLIAAVNPVGATVAPGADYEIGAGDYLMIIGEKDRLAAATSDIGTRVSR